MRGHSVISRNLQLVVCMGSGQWAAGILPGRQSSHVGPVQLDAAAPRNDNIGLLASMNMEHVVFALLLFLIVL